MIRMDRLMGRLLVVLVVLLILTLGAAWGLWAAAG